MAAPAPAGLSRFSVLDASVDAGRRPADREQRRAYEGFVSDGMLPGVRPVVADSWQRCVSSGLLPGDTRLPPLRTTSQALAEYRRGHPLAALLPVFRELLGTGAADDGHVFAIGDADGTLLWVDGDTAAVRRAERMGFVEGAVWSEAQAGTNAPGTALAVGNPVQIVSAEHYHPAAHGWSCAAAPVRQPGTGRLLGVVDLTGGDTIATPPALAAVRAAALAAEALLAHVGMADAILLPASVTARLAALGRDNAVLEASGRVHRLSRRHGEIVVALALAGHGMTGERLAVDLSEHELHPSTLRAEMTRLRERLGPEMLGSRPYELKCPVRTDFGEVTAMLARGRVGEALQQYAGPLLPYSDAPAVVERRRALEQQLRGAVFASGDPRLLRRWVDAEWGAEDGPAWLALAHALPGGSPQRAAAAARARALDAETCAVTQVSAHAALLQRSRS
ncbi:hypothetical protein QFZ66_002031 [Streptomyces sp. B4I13]|uniref:GAF domain-containing protein n=1 Tax=Streptomyces sp. B4I13 TaxID=3042271 RepID=UPI002782E6C0|nr:GAF domain-containing protein [Streptomyces sp. B4I13]MDQ0958153.1 hypothetical protein [Streptomyces sp. B4I13]